MRLARLWARRAVHPKAHGCVKADFTVNADIPRKYRVGLFATPGKRYKAWVRYSNATAIIRPDEAKALMMNGSRKATDWRPIRVSRPSPFVSRISIRRCKAPSANISSSRPGTVSAYSHWDARQGAVGAVIGLLGACVYPGAACISVGTCAKLAQPVLVFRTCNRAVTTRPRFRLALSRKWPRLRLPVARECIRVRVCTSKVVGENGTATPARTGDPQIHNLVL
jgi:hypothetical protein